MNYSNPTQLQAAILDWAGTVVDFGSFAPTQIFVEAFAEFDVQVSIEEARGPMGMGKWDHIRTLCDVPEIAERYRKVFGRTPTDDDVTAIYERFMPLQIEKIAVHSALIPGALDTLTGLRKGGLKIGSCSGYPKVVMDKVVELAAQNGYVADHVVATDETPDGRPWPAQALANAVPYMQAFGHTVLAWTWLDLSLKVGAIENEALAAGVAGATTYFFHYELPKAEPWLRVVEQRDMTCAQLPVEAF